MNIKERGVTIKAVLLENFQRSGLPSCKRFRVRAFRSDSSLCITTLGGTHNVISACGGCIWRRAHFPVQICNYVQYRSMISKSPVFLPSDSESSQVTGLNELGQGGVVYYYGRLHLSIRVSPWGSVNFKWAIERRHCPQFGFVHPTDIMV